MKTLLLFTLLFIYHTNKVNCFNLFNMMASKANDLVRTLRGAFEDIKNKVKTFIFPELKERKHLEEKNYKINSETNKVLSEFLENGAKSDTELNEYENLRSEPTALMSTPQLAALYGKRIESHIVLTKDGYILTLHRLRNSFLAMKEDGDQEQHKTVLLHHGLLGSSADWILLGSEGSLPYILSAAGYDVWLANARGNYYSRGHVSRNIDSMEFWSFSFQEIGLHDLPAIVEYIRMAKNSTVNIKFIGYSMGATAFLVMLSSMPYYNKYFEMAVLIAPLVYMANTKGPFKVLATMNKTPPEQLLKVLGQGEFISNKKIPSWLANKYCKGPEIFCSNPLLFLSDSIPEEDLWDRKLKARILYHIPAGGSTNTILHFAQIVRSGRFHKFDREREEFKLNEVSVPIVLISSDEDSVATVPDVLKLYFSISSPIDNFVVRGKHFKHTDFLWNPDANFVIYQKVIEFLKQSAQYNNASNIIESE